MNRNTERSGLPENSNLAHWSLKVPIRLKDENELLNRILEDEQMSVVIWTFDEKIIWVNRYAAHLAGSDNSPDKIALNAIIPKKVIRRMTKKINQASIQGFQYRYGGPLTTHDGKEIYITWHNYIIIDDTGKDFILSVGIDVTNLNHSEKRLEIATQNLILAKQEIRTKEEKLNAFDQKLNAQKRLLEKSLNELNRHEKALKISEERNRLMVEGASDGLWNWDIVTDTVSISERWKKFLDIQGKKITGHYKNWFERIHPDDVGLVSENLNSHLKKQTPYYLCEYRLKVKENQYIWILSRGKASWDSSGQAVRMAGSHTDITNSKIMENKLKHLALFDSLTDIPLRSVFLEKLKTAIAKAEKNKFKLAVFFLDVDNFKSINDTYGHRIGDQVLKTIAGKMNSCMRSTDLLARMGGDEFVILISNLTNLNYVNELASRIVKDLDQPFNINGHKLYVTISIGVSIYPDHGKNAGTLLKKADIAMYEAKEKGKNSFQYYTSRMAKEKRTSDTIKRDLRVGIENAEFFLCYQPIISAKTGKIICLEALLRWNHPRKGIIKPKSFIPVSEQTRLIIPLGDWVLRTACGQLKRWQEKGCNGFNISVNISMIQLQQPSFAESVSKILAQTGLPPHFLEIEITQTVLIGSIHTVMKNLSFLLKLGIQVTLDDFGTGCCSLEFIQKLTVNCLKIDQTFIRNIKSSTNKTIISSIISLGHKLKIEITAEGVETRKQYLELKGMECDYIQGYYFNKPLSPEEIERVSAIPYGGKTSDTVIH